MKKFLLLTVVTVAMTIMAAAQDYNQKLVLPQRQFAIFAVRVVNASGQVGGTFNISSPTNEVDNAFVWSKKTGLIDLSTLGGNTSIFRAMNQAGQVVGVADLVNGQTHAFRWTPNLGMRDLGTLGGKYSDPAAINAAGQVVGWSYIEGSKIFRAFLWSPGGRITDIGAGDNSQATGINDRGDVVGYFWDAAAQRNHGFLWSKSAGLQVLDPPDSNGTIVDGINNNSEVVGRYNAASVNCTCNFVWTVDTGYHTITTDLSQGGLLINASGTVSGFNGPNNFEHAYLWTIAGGRQDLGVLPGFANSYPTALNDKGEVLGYSCSNGAEGCENFVWRSGTGMTALTQSGGFHPFQDMNQAGQIVGDIGTGFGSLYLQTPAMHATLSPSANPSKFGQAVTFTAAITSVEGAPPNAELLTFYIDGKVAARVPLAGGNAMFTTSKLKAGTHTLSVLYSGDSNYNFIRSTVLNQVVTP